MKLNQTHKQAIVRAVIADIPRAKMTELEAFVSKCIDQDIEMSCPKTIAEAWKDKDCRRYLAVTSTNVGYLRTVKRGYLDGFPTVSHLAYYSFSEWFYQTIRPKVEELIGEAEAVQEAEEKLKAALVGIKTRKQFVETFPELAKYAPEEATVGTLLPALTNVVADLSKLGWPKEATA